MVALRAYRPETDEAFVYDSWMRSRRDDVERDSSNIEAYISRETWRPAMRSLIDYLMRSCDVTVAEAEGVILGWVARKHGSAKVLYAYVKQAYRGRGIFKRLREPESKEGQNGS